MKVRGVAPLQLVEVALPKVDNLDAVRVGGGVL
ncbi:hypothetical protein JOD67_006898 [Tenggerimyces flavus]|nr:hypothetical protein [Tenggerimyces flavus]